MTEKRPGARRPTRRRSDDVDNSAETPKPVIEEVFEEVAGLHREFDGEEPPKPKRTRTPRATSTGSRSAGESSTSESAPRAERPSRRKPAPVDIEPAPVAGSAMFYDPVDESDFTPSPRSRKSQEDSSADAFPVNEEQPAATRRRRAPSRSPRETSAVPKAQDTPKTQDNRAQDDSDFGSGLDDVDSPSKSAGPSRTSASNEGEFSSGDQASSRTQRPRRSAARTGGERSSRYQSRGDGPAEESTSFASRDRSEASNRSEASDFEPAPRSGESSSDAYNRAGGEDERPRSGPRDESNSSESFNESGYSGENSNDGTPGRRHGGFNEGDEGGDPNDGGRRRRRRRRRGRGGSDGGQQGSQTPRGQFVPQGNNNPRGRSNNNRSQGGHQRNQGGNRPYDQSRRGSQNPQDRNYNSAPRGPEVIEPTSGVLELHPKGYGFLRDPKAGYVSQETDPFVSATIIQKFGLREGVLIQGDMVQGSRGQGPRLRTTEYIDGRTPEDYAQIKGFDDLTPINPFEQIRLETGPTPITMRVMDLLTPIGKGQRALIVAPPRSGKTMLLQEIADAVSKNHPEIYLIVLLIDERPEEVTEMRRRVRGDVIASSMDREVENHVRVSQLIFERAKRLTESGRDVFILLDSITRTARAFNKWTGNTGRTMSGGLDIKAMDIPKKMFGQARRFEEGGSLTVVGTALVETGSKMDDVIFQEFKGTGNMEMVLSRDLADRRIWPAIDVSKSGTRREEKILSPEVMEGVTLLRRSLISLSPVEAMEQMVRILTKYKTNEEFLAKVRSIL